MRSLLDNTYAALKPVVLLALISVLWQLDRTIGDFRFWQSQVARSIKSTSLQVMEASLVGKRFLKDFEEEWNSPAAKLNRKHTFQVGEAGLAIAKKLELETVPAINETVLSTNRLVTRTDTQINDNVLPEATRFIANLADTAEKLGKTSDEATKLVVEFAAATGSTLEEARKLIASPEWAEMIRDAKVVTANTAKVSENAVLATENIVGSTEDIRKFTQATSKAQKVMLGIRIISGLAGLLAFF